MSISVETEKITQLLPRAMLRDRKMISRRLENLGQDRRGPRRRPDPMRQLTALMKKAKNSIREREMRAGNLPRISYPDELPITLRRRDIVRAIRENQVVIISGDTGSGKSTQIPKMCLEAGGGISGKIGCTQPRRIAAATIARRIAEELGEDLGRSVGYKIRFRDRTPPSAYIKIMTDGILLAETKGDPDLFEYDTLIIDEAHERTVNIDFILGILRQLLPRRPELKVVITSATMDTQKFSTAFGNAPVIAVSGRLYPVEVEYMPLDPDKEEEGDVTYVDMAVEAVDRLRRRRPWGDILIFMPTEQDILETCERLEGRKYPGITILPLFARLSSSRQDMIYSVKGAKIVVATNVAETSLTIPGIKYVIDTGLARIPRYLPRTRTNSLPVSPISRSSADQRKGRCGRIREGICIRLYSEEDYEGRLEFTPPEILRSNLAEVILRMIDLKMGDPESFPFIDAPHPRSIKDGFDLLEELGAIVTRGRKRTLTDRGRLMACMPLDPRISRMMIEASSEGCVESVAVIASALSIRDPRERPAEKAALADRMHAPFQDTDSDFLTLVNIWNRFHREWESLGTQNRMRKFCKEHFLSFNRMREWVYSFDQIMDILGQQEVPDRVPPAKTSPAERYASIHRSVLSGFLSNIALRKEKNIYQAARGREAMVFPGSTLFNKSAGWIVAAEMVKTSRLFARTAARIDPRWIEEIGGKLCRSSYEEPHWEKSRGEVRAYQKVTLYGLTLVSRRPVSYGNIHPKEAHQIFIRSALVEGEIKPVLPFLRHNMELMNKVKVLEDKLRRRDILVGEDVLAGFYSERLEGIRDVRSLKRLIRQKGGDDFLRMKEEDLLLSRPEEGDLALFPDEFIVGGTALKAHYRFSPGREEDGVTVQVPLSLASTLPAAPLEWGVPGLIKEKITALLKGLPKRYRKKLVPVSDRVDVILREIEWTDQPFLGTLSRFVYRRFGLDIPASIWAEVEIPSHLRTRIAITDHQGGEVRAGRDIPALLKQKEAPAPDSGAWKRLREDWERTGISGWDFDTLPESISLGPFLSAYPGLEVEGDGVNIRIFQTQDEALASHKKGVQRLLSLRLAKDLKYLKRKWPLPGDAERYADYFGGEAVVEKAVFRGLLNRLFRKNIRSGKDFEAYVKSLSGELLERFKELRTKTMEILNAYSRTRGTLYNVERANRSNQAIKSLCSEIRQELRMLVGPDFPERYDPGRLSEIPRYLKAMEIRVERGTNNPEKDRGKADQVKEFITTLGEMEESLSPYASREKREGIEAFRWMIEEFKVSLFAQELGTAFPVSAKRLKKQKQEIDRMV